MRAGAIEVAFAIVDGIECQDAYRSLYVPSAGAWVVAVSDGAGSRSRAAEGSALAAGLATSVFGTLLRTAGVPSDAAEAMELGADAVLVNTAIAVAKDPVAMARAFALGTEAGRLAYLAGTGAVCGATEAEASSPLTGFLGALLWPPHLDCSPSSWPGSTSPGWPRGDWRPPRPT